MVSDWLFEANSKDSGVPEFLFLQTEHMHRYLDAGPSLPPLRWW